jgi:hypothetical protein
VVDRLNGYSRLLYARSPVPMLPYGLRPGVETMLLGVPVNVNAQGFRGSAVASSPGPRRLLVLGDSVVFGLGVGDDETLPAVLRRRLGGAAEAVNLGVPGYDTAVEVEQLAAVGLALRPSAVVVGVSLNDYDVVPSYTALGVLARNDGLVRGALGVPAGRALARSLRMR